MEKVYSLPDLPRLPYSDLQALLVRLLEYRDFTVLPALFALLAESGEETLLLALRKEVYAFVAQYGREDNPYWLPRWSSVAEDILLYSVHRIYTTEALLTVLSEQKWRENEDVQPLTVAAPATEWPITYTAEETIPAGSVVALDTQTATVRIHPNPPVQ